MNMLVTGGAGYIGSHTTLALLRAGHNVIVVDDLSNSSREAIVRVEALSGKKILFYQCSIREKSALEAVFSAHAIDAVIHFAAFKAVGESVALPLKYYENNIGGTLTLCQVMQAYGVKKIVFSSSATVYGLSEVMPLTENMPIGATNPYGRTKVMMEQVLTDLSTADPSFTVSLLRYFNPVGADPSGLIGEDPKGIPNNLMPYITQVANGKLEKLRVFGDDYPTADGTGVRDYIHVSDLADGHLRALDYIQDKNGVHIHNLGTGRGCSVLELVNTFSSVNGVAVPYEIMGRRPGDIATCYADPAKAERELGWTAKYTIEDMCRDAWNWQSKNPNGYEG